jgi:hypothetical protein
VIFLDGVYVPVEGAAPVSQHVRAPTGAELQDLMARLAALVPPPRMHLTRFHGVFAPHSKLRAAVTPAHRGVGSKTDPANPDHPITPCGDPAAGSGRFVPEQGVRKGQGIQSQRRSPVGSGAANLEPRPVPAACRRAGRGDFGQPSAASSAKAGR